MKRIWYIILIMIMLLPMATIYGQGKDVKFQIISIEQGLSQSSIQCIIQDSKGFMWFGTMDGLNRYDGYGITTYRKVLSDPNSISDNNVMDLFEDHNLHMWIGTRNEGLAYYDNIKNRFIALRNDPKNSKSLSDNYVTSISEDASGHIWVATNNGLNRFKPKRDENGLIPNQTITRFLREEGNNNSLLSNQISKIITDRFNNIWIATDKGLCNYNIEEEVFTSYIYKSPDLSANDLRLVNNINDMTFDAQGNIWMATDLGLLKLSIKLDVGTNKKSVSYLHFTGNPDNPFALSANMVTSIAIDKNDMLWIGTEKGGLNRIEIKGDLATDIPFTHFKHDPLDQYSLSINNILSIFVSKSNILWVGTSLGGINKWDRATESIELYRHNPYDPTTISSSQVRSLYQDKEGIIWIGTVDGGLNIWDQASFMFRSFQHYSYDPASISNNHVRAIFEDSKKRFWIGTDGGGLNLMDRSKETFVYYVNDQDNTKSISNDHVWDIFEDKTGNVWIATYGGGLNKILFNEKGEVTGFKSYKFDAAKPNSLSNDYVTTVFQDSKGNLWVGTFGGGLNLFDPVNGTFKSFQYDQANEKSIGSNLIYSIVEDKEGGLWIGAKGNLNKYDYATQTFVRYTESNGLPNNTIMGIIDDDNGNLWISTNNGVSKFDKKLQSFKNYNVRDGLQSNEFLVGSFCNTDDGLLLFGGINGFNAFYPDKIKENPIEPEVVITKFQIFNQDANLDTFISEKQHIYLTYKDKVITFEFVALNYVYSDKNEYQYKLEGFDTKWNEIGNRRVVTFTNLPPGEYNFRVNGSNNDKKWNRMGASVRITITPPFWLTWWFYTLVAIGSLTLLFFVIWMRERQFKKVQKDLEKKVNQRTDEIMKQRESIYKQAEELALANKKLEKAYQEVQNSANIKQMFLANTSHEIRTPLNSILGYTNLLLNTNLDKKQHEYLTTIKTSGSNLLVIINDILDFSKIEAGKMVIEEIEFEFRETINNVINSVNVKAVEKRIDFIQWIDKTVPDFVYGDPVRLNQILINLLGNAIKFTPERGKVRLSVDVLEDSETHSTLVFKVADTGIGIAKDKLDKVFEVFTQERSDTTRRFGGTGLGLSIVKKLVDLQNGEIFVDSDLGKGSVFTFTFRYKIATGSITKKSDNFKIEKSNKLQRLYMLLVDDNPVNRALASDTLGTYNDKIQIDEAENGKIATEMAEKNNYDFVIMDIQMPEMDGLEATEYIRDKLPYPKNQVPILGMSAHAMKEEKDRCLNAGMNDYLTKPFIPEDLFRKLEELTAHMTQLYEVVEGENGSTPNDETVKVEELAPVKDRTNVYQTKYIDLTVLETTYEGNKDKLFKIVKLCLQNIPTQLPDLRKHFDAKDYKMLKTVAHSLKTSLNYLGLKDTRDVAKSMEIDAGNEQNLETVDTRIVQIENDWNIAKEELEYILAHPELDLEYKTAGSDAQIIAEKTTYENVTQEKQPDTPKNDVVPPTKDKKFKPTHLDLTSLMSAYKGSEDKLTKTFNQLLNNIPIQLSNLKKNADELNWQMVVASSQSLRKMLMSAGLKHSKDIIKTISNDALAEKNQDTLQSRIQEIETEWIEAKKELEYLAANPDVQIILPNVEEKEEQNIIVEPVKENLPSVYKCKSLNLSVLSQSYQGDMTKMSKILKLCLQNIPTQIEEMQKHFEVDDKRMLKTVAHSLKTSLNYLGLKDLRLIALSIETDCGKDDADLSDVPSRVDKIRQSWKPAADDIEFIVNNPNAQLEFAEIELVDTELKNEKDTENTTKETSDKTDVANGTMNQNTVVKEEKKEEQKDVAFTNVYHIIDLTVLNSTYQGNNEKINKILVLCLQNIPSQIIELGKFYHEKNWKMMKTVGMSLKTSLNYLGLNDAKEAARTIEADASDSRNAASIPLRLKMIAEVWRSARMEILQHLGLPAVDDNQNLEYVLEVKPEETVKSELQKDVAIPIKEKKKLPEFQYINLSVLDVTYQGDIEKMARILSLCYKNVPAQMIDLRRFYNEKNWKLLRTISHSLKTSFNYLGMKQSNELCKSIEFAAIEAKNLSIVPDMMDKIQDDWNLAVVEIEKLLNEYV